jgi:hypothetical protein
MRKNVLSIDRNADRLRDDAANKAEEWMTVQDVADELQVAPVTIHWWRSRGLGPAFVKLSHKCLRVSRQELNRWLAERAAIAATTKKAET